MPYRTSVDRWVEPPGDPRGSFLGNVFRAVTGTIGGAVTGFISKGIPGAIVGAAAGAGRATVANIKADAASPLAGSSAGTPAVTPSIAPPAFMMAAGPGGGIVTASPLGTPVSPAAIQRQIAAQSGMGHRGTHLNKSYTYSRRTGQLSAPGTKLVANRRMNWANGRALTRAERRIGAFVRHARKYVRWVSPNKKGKMVPRFGRKK